MLSIANAAFPGGGVAESNIMGFVPILLICAVFYFLVVRPHQTKMKQHKKMVDGLVEGVTVLTSGGAIGTVAEVIGDDRLKIVVADGVSMVFVKNSVVEVLDDIPDGKEVKGS